MLNYLWGFMIIIGVAFAAINGRMEAVTNAALDSAKEAVSLCITMVGIMALWVGLMEIAKKSGLIDSATRKLQPLIRFMFPDIPRGHEAAQYITTNIIANILGLGWAATPAGLMAMKALANLEKERNGGKHSNIASKEMCSFLVINISSLQLVPVTIIAYRSQYGSVNPASIVVPALIATSASTLFGIVFSKILCNNEKKRIERKRKIK